MVANDSVPILKISNYSSFINRLGLLLDLMEKFHENDKDYYNLDNYQFKRYLLMSLFSNMNETDFNYPLEYLSKMTEAYSTNYDFSLKKLVGKINIKGKEIEIYETLSKNLASMEAPVKKCFIFKSGNDEVNSPKIYYYIANKVCHIMAIQNNKNIEKNELSKILDRYFRKLDKGLNDIERTDNTESIKDISPNFLATLTLFIASLPEISNFSMNDYSPLRYMNRVGVFSSRNDDTNKVDSIQTNITNKFLLTGLRLCEHFDFPNYFFNNLFMFKKSGYVKKDDNIIYTLYESLNKENLKKGKIY